MNLHSHFHGILPVKLGDNLVEIMLKWTDVGQKVMGSAKAVGLNPLGMKNALSRFFLEI